MNNPETIGEHLRKRQRELGLNQVEIAKVLKVKEESITNWMHGHTFPQIQYYPRIIEFLGYNPFAVDTESIGGQIKKYRTENGLSHKRLAIMTGFDPATLASWEENLTVPYLKDKLKLVLLDIVK
jgi:transcriptional regulator with XRE-family HTH domain